MTPPKQIRNFCIIAHIDHGKSTLADRLLEITGTVAKRDMRDQVLDQMDIERERGITVKLAPVRMEWQGYELNLIDTPGHVDFSYEVSRSLAAVEGAVVVVDAAQGIQAQTLANLSLAREQGLVIIPVVNKIDLPNAAVEETVMETAKLVGLPPERVIRASGKTGQGVPEILDRIIADIPNPAGQIDRPLRALIFDSIFDPYQGVVAYVRVVDGQIGMEHKILLCQSGIGSTSLAVGIFKPKLVPVPELHAGEIGYIVTGLKNISQARVGDTIVNDPTTPPLAGYKNVQPMVYAGIYTHSGEDYRHLREAMEKLQLNDAALIFEPENSPALGYGFRCGFLGLLHLDIVQERLRREYNLELTVTVPSVAYQVLVRGQSAAQIVRSPLDLPDPASIERIEEPMVDLHVVTPVTFIGAIMEVTQRAHGEFKNLQYLDEHRAVASFHIPLASILVDYYDTLKSVTSGYASLSYELTGYQLADVVRLDILVAGDVVEALATIVYRDESYRLGRRIASKLKDVLPRQQFEVKIQAAIGAKIIASEHLPAMRKDVTAGLYGGDVTRKRKVLEKQKKGKARMKTMGKVEIPPAAYKAVLTR